MANFELKFIDVINPEIKLQIKETVYFDQVGSKNEKVIDLIITLKGKEISFSMDISTSIKVAKTLRTQINLLKESEDKNG